MPVNYQMRWDAADNMTLRVSAANPRYFEDPAGNIQFLTGPHNWSNMQDRGTSDPPPVTDFDAMLAYAVAHNHNFLRGWTQWEQSHWGNNPDWPGGLGWFQPASPYARSGPGNANDGKLKYDLDTWDESYFARIRARVQAARALGIYVSLKLFDGFSLGSGRFNATSGGWPFGSGNNINGVAASSSTFYTLSPGSGILARQEALVRKFIDAFGDLDNVLWEPANEAPSGSSAWQEYHIAQGKAYELTKAIRHPWWKTSYYDANDATLESSVAEAIAPANKDYVATTRPVLNDTDHSYFYVALRADGAAARRNWPFLTMLRGCQPLFMDPWLESWTNRNSPGGTITGGQGQTLDTYWDALRLAMGDARAYANRINLKLCTPNASVCSTGYCLANPGLQYLAMQTGTGAFTITLVAGTYSYEWFDVVARSVTGTGSFGASSGSRSFTPPNSNAHLLLLTQ